MAAASSTIASPGFAPSSAAWKSPSAATRIVLPVTGVEAMLVSRNACGRAGGVGAPSAARQSVAAERAIAAEIIGRSPMIRCDLTVAPCSIGRALAPELAQTRHQPRHYQAWHESCPCIGFGGRLLRTKPIGEARSADTGGW